MAFYGDLFLQDQILTFFGSRAGAEMTAIVRIYIPEGFVIAADGRKLHSENHSLDLENAIKIIQIESKGNLLGCSFTGSVQITADNSEEMAADFLEEAKLASKQLRYRRYKDLQRYAVALSDLINAKLAEIKSSGKVAEYPTVARPGVEHGATIAILFLDGFYGDAPSRVQMRFRHDNQKLLDPEITDHPIALGNMVQGPHGIPAFMLLRMNPPRSLAEAVEAARSYIESCSDPESIAIEPEACAKIGGHVHIATITRAAGFHWEVEPLH